ncbi:MAG TPA: indolepyruvate ferredoxin oxidoreductase family protein [Gammaproteobacteria bacterium]|nr:indolepyruvate ferredoxin oxidoreductase family protein [Gammaproteobacteria bacterium]
MANLAVTLEDRYVFDDGRIYLTGTQALVRLLLVQRRRDQLAGLNTAGFVSGYRGSPMTVIDQELWRAKDHLKSHHVHFWPAVNEHMAATALWGTQQVHYNNDANYDGVYGFWYGKGPGLDQSLDAMRQANYHGTAKNGGVLVLAGDDPAMRSTVDAYHSELLFEDLLMPVLYPADIQEVFDLGLYGIALSRFSGAWVGYKLLPETIETAASIRADYSHIQIAYPEFEFPEDGVNSRAGDMWFNQELRIRRYKLPAAIAFARANKLNRISHDTPHSRFGIAAMGKTWRDTLQALAELGIDDGMLKSLGIRILKVAMPFPVDVETYREFSGGLEEILVIEDKREQIENAIRRVCYDLPGDQRPRLVGRHDESGRLLVDDVGDLNADKIARVIASRIAYFHTSEQIDSRIQFLDQQVKNAVARPAATLNRMPYFCSGCPHNTSTRVPEGSRANGGVGCHFMAYWMDRDVGYATQMGGEGIPWVGQSPFVKTEHIFQQLGDGTYYHSGIIAIRAAVASGVNITYKILFNDAVAMTGGQPVDGPLSVPQITHQVYSEGIHRIAVVSDEPEKYEANVFAPEVTVHHREDLDLVQRELREVKGVSVLVYDQTCAAEKRRRRKRGTFPDPAKRMFINERVCEGCGDCGSKSNCVSIVPTETAFGRKRSIDQSSCNKDYSCNNGFCPSFVTVLGGEPRKGQGVGGVPAAVSEVPEPKIKSLIPGENYGILIGGVGGTGVVTIGALLGMAAHVDDRGVSIVDQMGFAQKGGAVMTHIRIAADAASINSARLNAGSTDLMLGCDMLVMSGEDALGTLAPGKTHAVVNTHKAFTGDFLLNPDLEYPEDTIEARLLDGLGNSYATFLDASELATRLLGDSIGSNLLLVGYAWQLGLIPLNKAAIFKAIELNGVKIDWNKEAFEWGRRAAHDLDAVENVAYRDKIESRSLPQGIDPMIDFFAEELIAYQDSKYADRYRQLIAKIRTAENVVVPESVALTRAVAQCFYKVMAYKDEYEVARLYAEPAFKARLDAQFEGDYTLQFNLSPPVIAPKDKVTGLPRKITLGAWMWPMFRLLAKFRFLRGSLFDVFGRSAERRNERRLVDEYEALIIEMISDLSQDNLSLSIEIASLPEHIRGYGHVKEASIEQVEVRRSTLVKARRNLIKAYAA